MTGTALRPPPTGPPARPDDPAATLTLEALAARLGAVERRLAALEQEAERPAAPTWTAPPLAAEPPREPLALVGLAGRTLMALGGGYLLRAATESQAWPGSLGAVAGLLYAVAWVLAGDRALRAGRTASGLLDGATAVLVAYPLLWESATRFQGLSPRLALCTAVTFAVGASVLALRGGWPALAWAHTLAAVLLALALLVSSHDLAAVVVALGVLHAGSELAADHHRGRGLRWATALPLDLALLVTVFVAGRPGGLPPGYPPLLPASAGVVVLGTCLLLLLHAGRRAWTRPLDLFDLVHAPVVLLVATAAVVLLLPSVAVACGIAALVGAVVVDVSLVRREFPAHNGAALAVAAAALTVAATSALLPPGPRIVAWSLVAVAAAARGRTCAAHRLTAIAFGAAAFTAGGGAVALAGLGERTAGGVLPAVAGVAAVAALVVWRWQPGAPTAILGTAALVALALGSLPLAGGLGDAGGTLAVAAVAVLLLAVGRRWERDDVARAGLVLLAVGGARLALVDLPGGRPAPLFVSLVSYGAALRLAQAWRGTAKKA